MKITKQEALDKIKELETYVSEIDKETKKVRIEIKNRWTGEVKFTSEKETIKEACQDNRANLSDANLYGANLSGANLSDANLYGANLSDANFSGANLSDANFSGADFSDADLSDADLSGAKFYGKGGTQKLTKKQLPDFLNALGFQVIE